MLLITVWLSVRVFFRQLWGNGPFREDCGGPAIFISSVLFDRGAGIYATALSTALLYLLMKPAGGILLPNEFILPLVIFILVALGLAIVSEGLRTAWERAAAAERAKDMLLQELGHRTKKQSRNGDLRVVASCPIKDKSGG